MYGFFVSIHAPLARCDLLFGVGVFSLSVFQSTHLLRGATNFMSGTSFLRCVSIHAPLARCDVRPITLPGTYFRFNPRTSCEVRQSSMSAASVLSVFQSTHLLRGATDPSRRFDGEIRCFNPRTSCEVRRAFLCFILIIVIVSIHAPLARCDPSTCGNYRAG